jgi:hypothetical protein
MIIDDHADQLSNERIKSGLQVLQVLQFWVANNNSHLIKIKKKTK